MYIIKKIQYTKNLDKYKLILISFKSKSNTLSINFNHALTMKLNLSSRYIGCITSQPVLTY